MTRPLHSICYHEAGHTLLALALRLPVASVSVEPRGDTVGRVSFERPEHRASASTGTDESEVPPDDFDVFAARVLQAGALVSVAGGEADILAGYDGGGCWQDEQDIRTHCERVRELLGVPGWTWEHVARTEARRYLKSHWPAVQRVADTLLVERTISGARALEVAGNLPLPDLRVLHNSLDFWRARMSARARAREAEATA